MQSKILFLCHFVLLVSLSSCTGNSHKNASKKELRTSVDVEPNSLDPRVGGNRKSQNIIQMLYEGLYRTGKGDEYVPAVAENYDISDDYRRVTFHLRDCKWSNGEPITAFDFERSWKEALEPAFSSDHSYAFYILKNGEAAKRGEVSLDEVGVKAVDDKTLFVEFQRPYPHFLEYIACPCYAPVYTKDSNDKRVSNGPFRMVYWKANREIKAVKNEHYWDKESVDLDSITVAIIEDTNTALLMWEQGELDLVGGPLAPFPVEAIPMMKNRGRLQTDMSGGVYWINFNTKAVPFNSAKVRKAFAYAINRQQLVDYLLQGGEEPAMSVLPKRMNLQDEGYFQDGNVEEARKLFDEGLKEIGMTRKKLGPIELNYCTSVGEKSIAQALQSQWKEVFGIQVNILGTERKAYLSKALNRDFMVRTTTWFSWTTDPSFTLGKVKSLNHNNMTEWENPIYKELIEKAEQIPDMSEKRKSFHEAEKILMSEMPIAPIYYHTYKMVINDDIKGFKLTKSGLPEYKYITMTSE